MSLWLCHLPSNPFPLPTHNPRASWQPVELFSAEISDPNFAVLDFATGAALAPGASVEALRLDFTPNSSDLLYKTQLSIVTNASQDTGPRAAFVIPLSVYHGRLTYTLSPSCWGGLVSDLSDGDAVHDAIDFGLLAVSEKRVCTLHLNNSNPMPVNLNGVSTTLPKVLRIRLEAVLQNGEPVAVPAGSSAVLGGLLGGGSQGGPPLLILEAGSSALSLDARFMKKELSETF